MEPTILLRKALEQLQKQRNELDRRIRTVEAALGTETRTNAAKPTGRRRRTKAARQAASRRMKEYWAKRKRAASAKGKGPKRASKTAESAVGSKAK
jgi:hypothetical protein